MISYDLPSGDAASVAVALTAAIAEYAGRALGPHQVAQIAHQLHLEALGRPCGVHAHAAAAFGGVTLSRVDPYPRVFVTSLPCTIRLARCLEERVVCVQPGRVASFTPHSKVAERLRRRDGQTRSIIWALRALPALAMTALSRRSFDSLGDIMARHASLVYRLCPELLTPEVREIGGIARHYHAQGVMADDGGGGVTMLCKPEKRSALCASLERSGHKVLRITPAPEGLLVWRNQQPEMGLEREELSGDSARKSRRAISPL